MPEKIIQVNQPMFETELDRMVSEKVTEILNRMLDAEADEIAGAARYECSDGRKAYRAGHYERDLTVKAGKMAVRVPKLKGALFESAVRFLLYPCQAANTARTISVASQGNDPRAGRRGY